MTTHRAESIMAAIELLLTNLDSTHNRIARTRFWPVENLPALTLEMGEETPLGDQGPLNIAFYDQQLMVDITIHVKTLDGVETELNQIVLEIWRKLAANHTLGLAYVEQIYYQGRDKPELAETGDQPTLTQITHWVVHYRHSRADPSL